MQMTPSEVKNLIGRRTAQAANFKKVDLHVHTDDSSDFPRENDFEVVKFCPSEIERQKPVDPAHFIQAALKKNLDLVAFTDHMRSRKSCEIAHVRQNKIVCLPGIEVNIRISQTTEESIHFICLFKEGKNSEDIERIFEKANDLPPYDQRKAESKISIDIPSFVKAVHDNDGICIASHVNDAKGLRKAFYDTDFKYVLLKREIINLQDRKTSTQLSERDEERLKFVEKEIKGVADQIQEKYLAFVIENDIDAVQVSKSSDFQFYMEPHTQQLRLTRIAALLSSDAHCLDAIGYEKKITYVKMATCNFQNLKSALHDPQTRIRYSDNLKTHNYPKIKGLLFLGGDGFFKPFTPAGTPQVLGFADNLTCFIGGRGSGKSATVDALRYIFKDKAQVESLRPALKKDVFDRSDHTLKSTSLYVLMESSDGVEVIVSIFYAGWESKNYESRFMDGTSADIILSSSTHYRVEIYGWSEIEDLGTDSDKQRELLDKFIPEIQEIQLRLLNTEENLRENRNHILEAAKQLEAFIPLVKDYSEAKTAFEKVNTPQMQTLFNEIDVLTQKRSKLQSLKEGIREITNKIDFKTIKLALHNIKEEILKDLGGELKQWAEDIFNKVFESKKEEHLYPLVTEILTILENSLQEALKNSEQKEKEISDDIEKVSAQVSKAAGLSTEASTMEKRDAFKKRYDALILKKENIKRKREDIEILLKERDTLLETFVQLQKERSKKRKDKKDEINAKLDRNIKSEFSVRIDFKGLGETKVFQDKLGMKREGKRREEGILKGVGIRYMDRNFAEIISEHMMPRDFVKNIMEGNAGSLILKHSDREDFIGEDDSQKIVAHLSPKVESYGEKHFDVEKLRVLLELEETQYEDLPEINLGKEPIMGLSPGQRCSALIPIVLLQGDCPLVIDQPEDNLDNKLVFDLVVDILRSLKEFRQIIVATHNPNIPVSGDAEQIILFESIDKFTGKTTHQGSIDDEIMISKVKEVMEGGELAFHTRAQKYRYTSYSS
jgi:hypothetical protein